MGRQIELRATTAEEQATLEQWARSGKTEKRLADRARIILLRQQGEQTKRIAAVIGCESDKVARWVHRFNEQGIAGLYDREGRGRRESYTERERSVMVASAKTAPQQLGQPFGYWSLPRLAEYLRIEKGIGISRAHLGRILEAEGLVWYQERSYFTERPDPQFAEKRGRL